MYVELIPYSGKFSKVQNFGVKLKCLQEEILKELHFEAPTYICLHKLVRKLRFEFNFGRLMVMFENFPLHCSIIKLHFTIQVFLYY